MKYRIKWEWPGTLYLQEKRFLFWRTLNSYGDGEFGAAQKKLDELEIKECEALIAKIGYPKMDSKQILSFDLVDAIITAILILIIFLAIGKIIDISCWLFMHLSFKIV